jgi:hypothetical protein
VPWISEPPRPLAVERRSSEIALWVSRGTAVVTVVSTVFEAAIAPGASIAQVVAFVITASSIVVGVAAGIAAALIATAGVRKRGFFWAGFNVVLGLACVALELFDAVGNMEP